TPSPCPWRPKNGQHTGVPPRIGVGSGARSGESQNTSRPPRGTQDSTWPPNSATAAVPCACSSSNASRPWKRPSDTPGTSMADGAASATGACCRLAKSGGRLKTVGVGTMAYLVAWGDRARCWAADAPHDSGAGADGLASAAYASQQAQAEAFGLPAPAGGDFQPGTRGQRGEARIAVLVAVPDLDGLAGGEIEGMAGPVHAPGTQANQAGLDPLALGHVPRLVGESVQVEVGIQLPVEPRQQVEGECGGDAGGIVVGGLDHRRVLDQVDAHQRHPGVTDGPGHRREQGHGFV